MFVVDHHGGPLEFCGEIDCQHCRPGVERVHSADEKAVTWECQLYAS